MKTVIKSIYKTGIRALSANWKPYSHLFLAGDNAGWILDWEMRELREIADRLGIRTASHLWKASSTPQAMFLASQFFLVDDNWLDTPHRIGFSYFHGLPQTGDNNFDAVYAGLMRNHQRLSRIQVSHTEMRDAVLQTGIDPSKVHLIPIGINLSFFHYRNQELRRQQRAKLGIPDRAFVIGSFQKDGNGWKEGLEPKLIKGPDIFIQTLEILKSSIPELFVLLTGPARGYVKAGLERLGIPYKHIFLKDYPDVGRLFPALDLYIIASRQEGGPKAVLESMASGVPLVTTRVGQAIDLVNHGQNGWMVDVEDVEGLAHWANFVHQNQGTELDTVLESGRATAETHAYETQIPLWREFMKGFVEWTE
ncbi:MAG: glycosyltransferase [Chloroflexi bacterium]|nr:glycosyltransferase [Chloroflexota bacterium]